MFESIEMKNFRSFGNVSVNFCDKTGKPKPIILVYGINGIGKSNLAYAFNFLSKSQQTMNAKDFLEHFFESVPDINDDDDVYKILKTQFCDLQQLIKVNKLIDSTENLALDFHFIIEGKRGRYYIETNDTEIVKERLEFMLNKNKGTYYEISAEKTFFSNKAFIAKDLLVDIRKQVSQYWGKHSLLAILNHELHDKTSKYFDGKLSNDFFLVLDNLDKLQTKVYSTSKYNLGISKNNIYLTKLESGHISQENLPLLKKSEIVISKLLSESIKDIKSAHYNIKPGKKDRLDYDLVVTKEIFGQDRDIPFSLESSGTKALLYLLPYIHTAIDGFVAIVDEFDIGLHEQLTINILESLKNQVKGQLLLTSHTTSLMRGAVPTESVYVIKKDGLDKNIKCILSGDAKIGNKNNVQNRYQNGRYDDSDTKFQIDFKNLLELIDKVD